MTQDEALEMACQAFGGLIKKEERDNFIAFANLVAAKATEEANARANASWTLMCKKMVAFEREACARTLESISNAPDMQSYAKAIRDRGEA